MNETEWLWMGEWKQPTDFPLNENRSFLYGDGFFESMRWHPDGTCQLWHLHWERLQRTLAALKYPWPAYLGKDEFANLIREKFPKNSAHDLRVKILFWRQGPGKYAPDRSQIAFLLSIEPYPFPWVQTIENVALAQTVSIAWHPFSWIKSTSAMAYVMASIEREERKLDDLVLPNADGYLIEGSYACLFWAMGEILYLTDHSLGGLDSCMRRYLEAWWKEKNFKVEAVRAKFEELETADWIGFGSGMGLRIKVQKGRPGEGVLPF